jgi:protein CLEC16A
MHRHHATLQQVLQTLSIIIQNVRSETGIFFLFSNNHINNIVDLDFDFSDEEVLGYYISFLKTISLKLNTGTVHFFLNSSPTGRGFPLYSRAVRLAHNREGMVRAAVRTLTLKVYSVPDPDIQAFVTAPPASHYFTEVAHYLAEQVQVCAWGRHVCVRASERVWSGVGWGEGQGTW